MNNNLGNLETMADNIQYYLDKHNMKRKDLVDMIGVPYTTICSWLSADAYPRIDKVEKMAQVFGISKADLVEKRVSYNPTAQSEQSDNEQRDSERKLMYIAKSLNDGNVTALLELAKHLSAQQEQ